MNTAGTDATILVDKEQLLRLCRQYGVASLRVFGSVARGEATPQSDIDILAEFIQPLSLLTLIRFERELSILLGRKVDLVTKQSLSPYIRSSVINSSRVLYDVSR